MSGWRYYSGLKICRGPCRLSLVGILCGLETTVEQKNTGFVIRGWGSAAYKAVFLENSTADLMHIPGSKD